MADKDPISGNTYLQGVSITVGVVPVVGQKGIITLRPNTAGTTNESFVIEQRRYGSGKPRRIIVRGKISRD